MQAVDLIIAARWVIPIEPAGVVLEDHAVAVHGGRIVDILPSAEVSLAYSARVHVQRPTHVLLPGLVNAHTHTPMTLFRGMADDLPFQTWLHQHIWPAEGRFVNADFVRDGAALAMLEMLRGGTTCFSDMYFFPDMVAQVATDMGLRASIGMILLEHPTVWATGPDEYLRKGLAVRDAYRGNPRVSLFFGPHAPYSVSDRSFAQIRVLADELDAPVQMHVHETAEEVTNSIREYGDRPLRRLERLQMVNPLLAAVHLTQLEPEEIALLAARSVSAVHCPESNLKLASGFCPVADLLAAGVNVALGTDGASSNNDLDMFGEMRTCALLAKGVSGRADVVPAATVLAMATQNGARALGLGDRIGSLRRGKDADLICVDLARPATWPVYNPISQLVYATSRDQVSDAWVAGQHLLVNGEPRVADADGILTRAEIWRERIANNHD